MEFPAAAPEVAREKLQRVRNTVLTLHKAVLDSERTAYEISHAPIGSPAAFLQLLINDPWFSWLQPMTNLIVQIDEALAAKRPPSTAGLLEALLQDTGALLSPSRQTDGSFWKRYSGVLQRDPAVAVLHDAVFQELQRT